LAAQEGGASRIELCANLIEGGTTPNFGLIKQCKKRVSIPIHVMIRPRGGDPLYTVDELKSMQYDLKCCRKISLMNMFGYLNNFEI
jgi:copper homeostasis protein